LKRKQESKYLQIQRGIHSPVIIWRCGETKDAPRCEWGIKKTQQHSLITTLTIVKHKKAIPYYGIIPLEVKLNEERQEKVKALAVKISALRKQSNKGQLYWDQNMELQPVQDWEEFDQQHEEYWSRPAGIKYTDNLLLLPDDDKELIKVILPEVKI